MSEKIEILYETGLWDKSGACELLFLHFEGDHLYGNDEAKGRKIKIRTAPRKFRCYDLADSDGCRLVYFNTESGYQVMKPDWKERNGNFILNPEETIAHARTSAEASGGYRITRKMLEGFSHGGFVFSSDGYLAHRDVSGGDWGQDQLVAAFCEKNVEFDGRSVFKICIESHSDLSEQMEMMMPLLRGNKWTEKNVGEMIRSLDTYDSNVYLDMKDDKGKITKFQIRMDGGKIRESYR